MKYLPQSLWIVVLVVLGLAIAPNLYGWGLLAFIALLIYPRFWEAFEGNGKNTFAGLRTTVAALFTITMAYAAWGRVDAPMPFVGSDAKAAVAASMRDPSSAEFRNILVGVSATCGEVNGRNGFGGYAGFRPFVFVNGVVRFEPEPPVGTNVLEQTEYLQEVAKFAQAKLGCYEM